MAKRRKTRRNPGNVFLSDEPEYQPKPRKAPVYGESGIDAGKGEDDFLPTFLAVGVVVAAVVASNDSAPAAPTQAAEGESALKQIETAASKIDIPIADPLPLAPSVNQVAEGILAEQMIAAAGRLARALPNYTYDPPPSLPVAPLLHQAQMGPPSPFIPKVSYFDSRPAASAGGGGSKGSGSDITGTKTSTPPLPPGSQTVAINVPKSSSLRGYGEIPEAVVSTGAQALQELQSASEESSNYMSQAVVNPDQIVENTKKMSPLGLALTLYSLHWAYKLVTR